MTPRATYRLGNALIAACLLLVVLWAFAAAK